MTSVTRAMVAGVLFGLMGVAGQLFLLWLNAAQTAPFRALLTFVVAALIGALAGFTGGSEALKAAALTGFVAGGMLTAVGMSLAIRTSGIIGNHPFASAETALSFMSSLLIGTIISSWLVAGVAILVALPISQTLRTERKPL